MATSEANPSGSTPSGSSGKPNPDSTVHRDPADPPPLPHHTGSDTRRLHHAERVVEHYSKWAAGLSLIPVPIVDLAFITGAQLKMLRELCKIYEVSYDEQRIKTWIAAVAGGVGTTATGVAVGSLLKMVPVVGHVASALTLPAFAYASTNAIGKVMIPHFESGGNLYTLDPEKHKAYYAYLFKEGQKAAAEHK